MATMFYKNIDAASLFISDTYTVSCKRIPLANPSKFAQRLLPIVSIIARSNVKYADVLHGKHAVPFAESWKTLISSMSCAVLCNLKHLTLDFGILEHRKCLAPFANLVNQFANNGVTLISLNLKSKALTQTCIDAMAGYLLSSAGHKLESLQMRCDLSYDEIDLTLFSQSLATHTSLTYLELLNLSCDADVAPSLLRDAVICNTSLRFLNLSGTGQWKREERVKPTTNPYCDIVLANKPRLRTLVLGDNYSGWHYYQLFLVALAENYSLTRLDLSLNLSFHNESVAKTIDLLSRRNRALEWSLVHANLLDVCVAFSPFELPPYVLLEIFDWLPTRHEVQGCNWNQSSMHHVSHIKKIRLLEGVQRSRKAVLAARETRCKSIK
jgi:hypothetical protein